MHFIYLYIHITFRKFWVNCWCSCPSHTHVVWMPLNIRFSALVINRTQLSGSYMLMAPRYMLFDSMALYFHDRFLPDKVYFINHKTKASQQLVNATSYTRLSRIDLSKMTPSQLKSHSSFISVSLFLLLRNKV
jgi:hypothetical protein